MTRLFDLSGNPIIISGPNRAFDEIKAFLLERKMIEQAKDTMADEGCVNLEPLPTIDLDVAAPVVIPTDSSETFTFKDEPIVNVREALESIGALVKGKPIMAREDVKHYDLMTIRPYLKTQGARLTRKRYSETPVRTYLHQVQPVGLAEKYLEFYDAHPFFLDVCAGAKHHHWWKGGLEEHCSEMCGIGLDIMDLYSGDFAFSKSSLIISIFLHDFAKIWTYKYITPEEREKNPKKYKDKQVFTYTEGQFDILNDEARTLLELGRAGIIPTDEEWSAVLFAEGGFSQAMYDFGGRSGPGNTVFARNHLATFLSILDSWSAAILGRSLV